MEKLKTSTGIEIDIEDPQAKELTKQAKSLGLSFIVGKAFTSPEEYVVIDPVESSVVYANSKLEHISYYFQREILAANFDKVKKESNRKSYIVVDIDGTLSNLDHRLPLIKKESPDWDTFYSLVKDDKMNEWCSELIKMMCLEYSIILVSGRRSSCKADTIDWLKKNGLYPAITQVYLLRGDKDYTPDHELKRQWLHKFGKEKILFVIEDRKKVKRMWVEEGVFVLDCNQEDKDY